MTSTNGSQVCIPNHTLDRLNEGKIANYIISALDTQTEALSFSAMTVVTLKHRNQTQTQQQQQLANQGLTCSVYVGTYPRNEEVAYAELSLPKSENPIRYVNKQQTQYASIDFVLALLRNKTKQKLYHMEKIYFINLIFVTDVIELTILTPIRDIHQHYVQLCVFKAICRLCNKQNMKSVTEIPSFEEKRLWEQGRLKCPNKIFVFSTINHSRKFWLALFPQNLLLNIVDIVDEFFYFICFNLIALNSHGFMESWMLFPSD
ncbi:hypothetical protein GQR58_011752 [Nymphon striatum]|nr:hypothetical protein GQR58_011752 [Nymphon striatum]